MSQLVSPLIPFPNIKWWMLASNNDNVVFDIAEHFVKMTYRNRYYITGANGMVQLSVPLLKGRNQRTAMSDIMIDNSDNWQVQHWRTIKSVYGRSPFYEHYGPSLELLYQKEYKNLMDFNEASIVWLKQQLDLSFETSKATAFVKHYEGATDIRSYCKPNVEKQPVEESKAIYYQMFKERNGFYRNLSMLDLLFAEGPMALHVLQSNVDEISSW